jgi:RNA-dependent RNA polymerase
MLYTLTTRLRVRGGTLKFIRKGPLPNNLRETLQKVPYIDPCMVQEREQKIAELDGAIRISTVQIGALYFNSETKSRAFSVEWDYDCVDQDPGWLRVYYEHRVIRIDIGDPVKGAMKRTLVIKLSSINRMERGVDMDAPCKHPLFLSITFRSSTYPCRHPLRPECTCNHR